jgi:hypothetical protein
MIIPVVSNITMPLYLALLKNVSKKPDVFKIYFLSK